MGYDPGRRGVGVDRDSLDAPPEEPGGNPPKPKAAAKANGSIGLWLPARGAAVRRVEPPLLRRHRVAAAARALAGTELASFFRAVFDRFSVPTSVSLSSPRMKASTR
jgi:hypothetical protein